MVARVLKFSEKRRRKVAARREAKFREAVALLMEILKRSKQLESEARKT